MDGAERIAKERQRQKETLGWTPEHDDEYVEDQLTEAAVCYALAFGPEDKEFQPETWPWESLWWKPEDRIRNLEKAGALIAAEIDRLLREESK